MNRFEQEYYANINGIAKALDRIANALENNNEVAHNVKHAFTGMDGKQVDKIYYKSRKDMFADNPCTKEEHDAVKQDNEELDTQHDYLHGLVQDLDNEAYHEFCNAHCLPASDAVAVSNYITDLDYDEVLGIINDLKAQNKYTYVSKVGKIRNDSDFELRKTAKMYEDDILANGGTKKECILDYVTNVFGSYGARYTDVIKFAYYLGAYNAPKFNNSNRGYYACALTHGRWNTGHLVTGGKDQLVKGINSEGKERYFALSNVDSFTDYYKRLDE